MRGESIVVDAVAAAFTGFFLALAVSGTITAAISRSASSAWYACAMVFLAAIEGFGILHGARPLHAVLLAAYLCSLVTLTFVLLQTMRYDETIAKITVGILTLAVVLLFAEAVWLQAAPRLADIERVAVDLLLLMLIACGARAIPHEEQPLPGLYLAALCGPVAGVVASVLTGAGVLPHALWTDVAIGLGQVWLAVLLGCGVAVRNHGIQVERTRFERLAYVDGLTGVANRRTFDETLERMWNVARRAQVPVAIAMIDIDHFKRLNDTRGHQVGDECLRRVAALCSSVLRRAGDCFARYGGEEFAAILVNIDLDHAVSLAESIRRTVERDGGITVSIGVAARTPLAESAAALVADADQALYVAKHEGRNCVRVAGEAPAPQNVG